MAVTMKPLPAPDNRHLRAAQGWCELHAFVEAGAELDNITASLRAHPKVLEVRWQIYANLEKWAGALGISNAIVTMGRTGRQDGFTRPAAWQN